MSQHTMFDVCKAIMVSYYDIVVEKMRGLGRYNENTPYPKLEMATAAELKTRFPDDYSEDRVFYCTNDVLVIASDLIDTVPIRDVCRNIAAGLLVASDALGSKIQSGEYTQPIPYRIKLSDEEQKDRGMVNFAKWMHQASDPIIASCTKLFPEVIGDPSPREVADANSIIPIETIFPHQWVEYLFDGRLPNEDYDGVAWMIMSPVLNKWNSKLLVKHTSLQQIANGKTPSTWTELDKGWMVYDIIFAVPAEGYTNADVKELFKRAAKSSATWVETCE